MCAECQFEELQLLMEENPGVRMTSELHDMFLKEVYSHMQPIKLRAVASREAFFLKTIRIDKAFSWCLSFNFRQEVDVSLEKTCRLIWEGMPKFKAEASVNALGRYVIDLWAFTCDALIYCVQAAESRAEYQNTWSG